MFPSHRLADDTRNDGLGTKRQRHDELDLQDDVFSDFYILPPTPRLLSHIDDVHDAESAHHHLVYTEDRLGGGTVVDVRGPTNMVDHTSTTNVTSTTTTPTIQAASPTATTTMAPNVNANPCNNSVFFPADLDDPSTQLVASRSTDVGMMEVADVVGCDPDRICDFARFADSAKTLEERLVELQSLDEHFDLAKFERNNNQSCGRAFHDIQTFHSLVPGLET